LNPAVKGVGVATGVLLLTVGVRSVDAKVHPTEVVLYKDAAKCEHKVDRVHMKKFSQKKDVAIWDVGNYGDQGNGKPACDKAAALLCTYVKGEYNPNVFEPCASTPFGSDLNKPFLLNPDGNAHIACQAKPASVGMSGIAVVVFSQESSSGTFTCPTQRPPQGALHHVIDIEIVP